MAAILKIASSSRMPHRYAINYHSHNYEKNEGDLFIGEKRKIAVWLEKMCSEKGLSLELIMMISR
ncbi:hypothetical protein LWC05_12555 [Acetobacter sicerae]|uniref:Uncharacterized protein n=1 Tax=Acetobacter sicerae TaxID=85325 RepID=A0ABS8VZX3_9PROT|nr:hypothetical protein [Acetobacter sicerae]MCE0744709.1 hypothetical protein [Acetobacter sicerae]